MYQLKPDYISIEEILNKVSQEEIWERYLGFLPPPGSRFSSVFREDRTPSANLFYADNGTLLYKDFAGETLNCWNFVAKLYNLSFRQALIKIWCDFTDTIENRTAEPPPTKFKERKIHIIQVKKRPIEARDLSYWGKYFITREILEEYEVYPITYFWINGQLYSPRSPLAYSYEFGQGKRKIYFPFEKERRFLSNVPSNIYSGYDQLPHFGEKLILTKSHKDVMVWKILGFNAIAPQGESFKIDKEFLNKLQYRFKEVIINYDNDEVGKKASAKLASQYQLKEFFTPLKDISDTIEEYKMEKTKQIIVNLY